MKVLHLSTSDRGGAGIAAVRLHKSMLERGIDSHLLTLHHSLKEVLNHPNYKPETGWRIPFIMRIYYFFRKALDFSGLFLLPHKRIAKKHLKGRPPGFENFSFCSSIYDIKKHPLYRQSDIIHLHWISEGFIDYNSFFKDNKKNIVWTLHDMNPFTGGCHHSDNCLGFTSTCSNCPQLANTIDNEFAAEILKEKIVIGNEESRERVKIVTPSKWLGKLSSASKLFSKYDHFVIANGIDHKIFKKHPKIESKRLLGISPDKKVILFVSHSISHPRKGISFLRNVLKKLSREDLVFVSVGSADTESMNDLDVMNLGYISDEERMSKIYSASDLFVLPSLAENFPNTICEALLCGVPVVSFNVGGIPELVNENNGILAEPLNEESLMNAIKKILDNPESFSSETIMHEAISKLSAGSMSDEYLKVYKLFDQN